MAEEEKAPTRQGDERPKSPSQMKVIILGALGCSSRCSARKWPRR